MATQDAPKFVKVPANFHPMHCDVCGKATRMIFRDDNGNLVCTTCKRNSG